MDPSTWIHDLSQRWSTFDSGMTFAAQYLVYAAALILPALWTRRNGVRAVAAAVLGVVLALVVAQVVGAVWERPRPFAAEHFTPLFNHAADASFPSDHLCALGAITAAAWIGSRALGLLSLLLAAAVAFARVYAGVHYVGDVVGGFLIGAVCGTLAWFALAPFLPLLDRLPRPRRV
jgi:undecaprenyl-diphosphatase